jgi:hypothetical protein
VVVVVDQTRHKMVTLAGLVVVLLVLVRAAQAGLEIHLLQAPHKEILEEILQRQTHFQQVVAGVLVR